MILAAGRGERLKPLTERIPKPMIPIGSEPLIVHQLRWLHRAGIRDVVINVHHLGEQIERGLGTGADQGVRIGYSREEDLLDTGGGVKKALPLLGPEPFIVLNGDIWTNFPFRRLGDVSPQQAYLVLTPTPPHLSRADFRLEGDLVASRRRRGRERPHLLRLRRAVGRVVREHAGGRIFVGRSVFPSRRRRSAHGRGFQWRLDRHWHA